MSPPSLTANVDSHRPTSTGNNYSCEVHPNSGLTNWGTCWIALRSETARTSHAIIRGDHDISLRATHMGKEILVPIGGKDALTLIQLGAEAI
jgi:hypothetical protein